MTQNQARWMTEPANPPTLDFKKIQNLLPLLLCVFLFRALPPLQVMRAICVLPAEINRVVCDVPELLSSGFWRAPYYCDGRLLSPSCSHSPHPTQLKGLRLSPFPGSAFPLGRVLDPHRIEITDLGTEGGLGWLLESLRLYCWGIRGSRR